MKTTRERYLDGEIFNLGDLVECDGLQKIVFCGANHLIIEDTHGVQTQQWLDDVTYLTERVVLIKEETIDRNRWLNIANEHKAKGKQKQYHEALSRWHSDNGRDSSSVREKERAKSITEDVATSDYKVSANGRKYPAHRIDFKNSTMTSKSTKVVSDTTKFESVSEEEIDGLVEAIDFTSIRKYYDISNFKGSELSGGENLAEETLGQNQVVLLKKSESGFISETAKKVAKEILSEGLYDQESIFMATLKIADKIRKIERENT